MQKLRIGYLGTGMREHSTGFLSKDIISKHDPDRFEVHYFLYQAMPDRLTKKYFKKNLHTGANTSQEIVNQVRAADLDILVYLDSTTRPTAVAALTQRLAPIQLSWLGGDSPGIPEIDGILADRHLIPDPSLYREEILYLPSFCAVGSLDCVQNYSHREARRFLKVEATTPLLWTAAPGFKRSDSSVEAHCRILAETGNSVLVVKGNAATETLIARYRKYSDPLQVTHRIRFTSMTPSVEEHRAQLMTGILFLDTWPYSASTHAIEALSLGLPVLALPSQHYYGRQSLSALESCGLGDMACADVESYIQQAVDLIELPWLLEGVKKRLFESHRTAAIFRPTLITETLESHYAALAGTHHRDRCQGSTSPALAS